ncbi:flap endonuclease GEN homolog 1 isoform X2 [Narcine bancroftii]
MDVRLIFVVEGTAPKLKAETMSKRNEIRYGGCIKQGTCIWRGRSHFKSVLKECCELLDYLGNPWICAAGEAEAMCAYLNENGYTDGCITNDGDVFLYGAQTVYRNLTISIKDPHVDCYKMSDIKSKLGLDRDALIGLAILLGCDYLPKGVPGVGKELALRLVETMNGQSLLQRFNVWKREFDEAGAHDSVVKKKVHCSVCRHPGFANEHATKGCNLCASNWSCLPHSSDYLCSCDWHQVEQKRKNNSLENIIKKKAKACEHFPFKEVIREFLVSKDQPIQKVQWKRPKLLFLQNFALDKMVWPRHYTCEKVLPLLSHYDMKERRLGQGDPCHLQPVSIVKTRIRNGIPCFEILWEKPEHYVYSNEQSEGSYGTVTTIEEQVLFEATYPDITTQFHHKKEKKHQKRKSRKNDKTAPVPDEITQLMSGMSLQSFHNSLFARNESGEKCAGQETNPSSCTDWSSCIDISTEYCASPKKFWRETANEVAQPTNNSTEKENSDSESTFLKTSENRKNCSTVSPSVSLLVADLHLSDIDWSSSFSTQFSEHTSIMQTETSEQAQLVINDNSVLNGSSIKLVEGKVVKENTQERVQKSLKFVEDASMLQDFNQLPLKDRILFKNACQLLSLPQPAANSIGNNLLPCSTSFKSAMPPAEAKLVYDSNEKKLTKNLFSETQQPQQEQRTLYNFDQTAGHHSRLLIVPERKNVKDSVEKVVGIHDSPLQSYQISKSDSVSLAVEKSKVHEMKPVTGSRSTIAKKSVCCDTSLSSEDSDAEKSRKGKQKRFGEDTVKPFCAAKLHQPSVQQKKSMPRTVRSCGTSIQSKVIDIKNIKTKSKIVISQKNTSEAKPHSGNTILLKSPLSSMEHYKHSSDGEDSIIVISDSPLPLSEKLKLESSRIDTQKFENTMFDHIECQAYDCFL